MQHIIQQWTEASPPKEFLDQDERQSFPESPTQFMTGCDQFLKRVDMNYMFKLYPCKNPFSLLQELRHPLSHWKWSMSLKASVASEQMTPLICVGGTLQCSLALTAGSRLGPCHSHPLYPETATWRHLFLSFNIFSLPLIFMENPRIVKITVRMGLGSSLSAKTCQFLKHWSVTQKCWLDRTKACGHSHSARVDNITIHIKGNHDLSIQMSLLYIQDDDAMKLPRRCTSLGATELGMGHLHTLSLTHSYDCLPPHLATQQEKLWI